MVAGFEGTYYTSVTGCETISRRKAVLLFLIVLAVSFTTAIYILDPPNFMPKVQGLWNRILALPQDMTAFIQNPTAAIGTAVTGIGGLAGAATLYSKLKSTRQQATEVISDVKNELSTTRSQYSQLKTDYESLKTTATDKIKALETDKLALQTTLTEKEAEAIKLKAEVQNVIGERNTAERIAAQGTALLEKCRYCSQPILPGQTYCQYCGKPLIVS